MSEAQAAQRDESPMDVDQPSPLDQDPAPLGRTRLQTAKDDLKRLLILFLSQKETSSENTASPLF